MSEITPFTLALKGFEGYILTAQKRQEFFLPF